MIHCLLSSFLPHYYKSYFSKEITSLLLLRSRWKCYVYGRNSISKNRKEIQEGEKEEEGEKKKPEAGSKRVHCERAAQK